ncbi:MAG: OmpA family protein, partial [Rhodospirillales bacterium]
SKVPSGLRADTERRKYAKSIGRQGNAKNVLAQEPFARKPQPAQVASTPPPPKAAPAPSVSRASAKMMAPSATQNSLPPVRLRPPSQMAAPTPSRMAPTAPRLSSPSMRTQQLAVRPTPKMAPAAPSLTYDPFQTVVVSSKGMEMAAQSQAIRQPTMRQQVLPSRSLAQFTQQATPGYPSGAVMSRQPTMGQGMVKVASILFSNGSSRLSSRDQTILNDVAQIQRESGGRPLVIVGHASSRTRDMKPLKHRHVNLRLSQNRANIVARALRRLGVPGQSVQTQAVGDTQPVYYEVMSSGEAGNRRAEVYINY